MRYLRRFGDKLLESRPVHEKASIAWLWREGHLFNSDAEVMYKELDQIVDGETLDVQAVAVFELWRDQVAQLKEDADDL